MVAIVVMLLTFLTEKREIIRFWLKETNKKSLTAEWNKTFYLAVALAILWKHLFFPFRKWVLEPFQIFSLLENNQKGRNVLSS